MVMLNLNTNWVSDTIKFLNQWWPIVKSNFQAIQTAFNNHLSGIGEKHNAQNIDYSGDMPGSNVKSALDNHIGAVSGSRHNAQDINYSGSFIGKTNVKDALNQAKSEIDTIVVNASIDPEVALARQSSIKSKTFTTLDGRLEEIEQDHASHLSDYEKYVKTPLWTTNIIDKMRNGEVVVIVCYGDSIFYGDLGNGTAIISCPARLQTVLRSYYNNNNITVINKGVNGRQSDEALASFDADVLTLNPDAVFIMFGINDTSGLVTPLNTLEQYKTNIAAMIKKSIANGIQPLLLTPTPTHQNLYGYGNKRIYLFGRACIEIAKKFDIPFIDIHKAIYDLYSSKVYSLVDLQGYDYVHFTELGYTILADMIFKFGLFESNDILTINKNEKLSIPVYASPFIKTNFTSNGGEGHQFFYNNYRASSNNALGTYLTFEFFNNVGGMDLSIVAPKVTNGGKLTVYDNGIATEVVDFYSKEEALYDVKNVILKNMSIGYHKIELKTANLVQGQSATSPSYLYISAFIFEPSKFVNNDQFYPGGTTTYSDRFKKVIDSTINFHGQAGNYTQYILFDTPALELITGKTLVVETEGKFVSGSGLLWFANKAGLSNASGANFGYILVFGSTNILLFGPSGINGLVTQIASATVTLDYNNDHTIRIEQTKAGVITIKIDGTTQITVTDTSVDSGYMGLYSQSPASEITVKVKRLEYCYK
jgi:lysophospholipase L1-like esterase